MVLFLCGCSSLSETPEERLARARGYYAAQRKSEALIDESQLPPGYRMIVVSDGTSTTPTLMVETASWLEPIQAVGGEQPHPVGCPCGSPLDKILNAAPKPALPIGW